MCRPRSPCCVLGRAGDGLAGRRASWSPRCSPASVLLAGGRRRRRASTTAAKWLLVGRFRAGERPLWSSFVWRNELADTFVEVLAVPWLVRRRPGTPLLTVWLRTLGARIGRGVWLETYWLPEADLVTLGDGATVNRGCVVQTHLFHDRIMSMDRCAAATGATLGPHGIVLPGASIGARTTVGPGSLVTRGDTVRRARAGSATRSRRGARAASMSRRRSRRRAPVRPTLPARARQRRLPGLHYDLDLDYRLAANRLAGRAVLTAVAGAPLSRFSLDLSAFRVPRVIVDGRSRAGACRGLRRSSATARRTIFTRSTRARFSVSTGTAARS